MTNPLFEQPPEIDASNRYDIYSTEFGLRVVVYRNVLIKGRRKLPGKQQDFGMLLELEDSVGNIFFITSTGIAKICSPGVVIASEEVYSRP